MRYDTFLLDVDDTVFDFSACAKNALFAALSDSGIEPKEEYHARYLAINDRLWGRLERGEIGHGALVEERFRLFLKEIGREDVSPEDLNARYVSRLSLQTQTFAGAEEFLAELCKLGRIYIVTNGTACVQRERFSRFRMERFAAGVFISEEIGYYKPSHKFYRYCVAHIPRYRRERTLLIGDGLSSDIPMAQQAGVDCVWFNPKGVPFGGERPPTFEARTYQEALRAARRE